jgi:hypothetical protein
VDDERNNVPAQIILLPEEPTAVASDGEARRRPPRRPKAADPRVNLVRSVIVEELQKAGKPFSWSYERDGANAKRILKDLDAQKDRLEGLDPIEAVRLAFRVFLEDKRAEERGFPITWFWRGWDSYLRIALHRLKDTDQDRMFHECVALLVRKGVTSGQAEPIIKKLRKDYDLRLIAAAVASIEDNGLSQLPDPTLEISGRLKLIAAEAEKGAMERLALEALPGDLREPVRRFASVMGLPLIPVADKVRRASEEIPPKYIADALGRSQCGDGWKALDAALKDAREEMQLRRVINMPFPNY